MTTETKKLIAKIVVGILTLIAAAIGTVYSVGCRAGLSNVVNTYICTVQGGGADDGTITFRDCVRVSESPVSGEGQQAPGDDQIRVTVPISEDAAIGGKQ